MAYSFGARPNIVTSGMVLHLDAGNTSSYPGSGSTWTDLSGNGFNVELVNGPTFDSTNGGSIVFDGTNDYAKNGADYSTLDFVGSSFSICVWINRIGNVSNDEELILNKESGIPVFGGYQFTVYGSGSLVYPPGAYALRVRDSSNNYDTFVSAPGIVLNNNWIHLCVIYNGSTITGYVNGVFNNIKNTSISSIGNTNAPLGIYGTYTGYVPATNYKMASLNMYNRALTSKEVFQNYYALKGRFGL